MSENREVEHDVFVGRHTGPWRTTGADGESRQLVDLLACVPAGETPAPAQLSVEQARSVALALLAEVEAIERGAGAEAPRERPSIIAQLGAELGRHGIERTITLEPGIYHVRFEFKGRGGQALNAVSYDPLVLGAMDGLRLLEGVEVASLALRLGAPDVGGEPD